ncbi:MAG TPA: hypothetical protein VFA26_10815 [Gemmataceae bacterium]|nr:hypothetical protein [Gemmataceae bacterium]
MGISTSGAHKCVRTALTEARQKYQEDAAELIELEKERLDTLQAAYWPDALAGDVQAAHVVLACTAQRRKLLGLDAPKRVEVDQTIRSGLSEQQLLLLAEAVGLDKLMVIDQPQTPLLPISVPAASPAPAGLVTLAGQAGGGGGVGDGNAPQPKAAKQDF